MTLDDDVGRLAGVRPFSLLPRDGVQLIAFSCPKRRLKAGEVLFFAGESAEAGYFIHSGIVALTSPVDDVKEERRIGAGGLIGEHALYVETTHRCGARASADALVTAIGRETFRRVLAEFPVAAQQIRGALASRTRRLIDGLEGVRVSSFESSTPARRPAAP